MVELADTQDSKSCARKGVRVQLPPSASYHLSILMEEQLKVKDIMTKDVVTIQADMPMTDAANLLVTRGFTGAPVVDQGNVVGIVTEADFLTRDGAVHLPTFLQMVTQFKVYKKDEERFKEEFQKFLHTKVRDIMTANVITVGPETTVEETAKLFASKHVNPIPVVHEGKLVGIISRSDIVRIFQL